MRDRKLSMDLFNLYLNNLEISRKLMDTLIPIIWKFDGKVYNARFDNAIKKILEERETEIGQRVWTSVSLSVNMFNMELHFTKRSVHVDGGSAYLPSCYDEDSIRIYSDFSCYGNDERNKKYHDKDSKGDNCYFYIDENFNNRIKSEAIVNAMVKHQKELADNIKMLKAEVLKLDEYETRAKELKEAMEQLHKAIPYMFSDFFDLHTYATYQ
jgi:hypothetical protein